MRILDLFEFCNFLRSGTDENETRGVMSVEKLLTCHGSMSLPL